VRFDANVPRTDWTARRRLIAAAETWTQRVGGYTALPSLFRELGTDPSALLAAAGLSRDALDQGEARMSYGAFGRLLEIAVERTRCDHVGLLAGRMLRLRDLGGPAMQVRNGGTVRQALETLVAQQHRDSEGALVFLVEADTTVELGYAIYHPYAAGTDQIYDCALAALTNYLRELCGPDWLPSEVLVPHARRSDDRPYRTLLRANPRFDAETGAIRFSSRWMCRPVACDERSMPTVAAPSTRESEPDVVQQVCRALRAQLLEGRASGDDVADALGMNRRTLNRRLRARGLTYQRILDEVRFGLARQLLSTSRIGLYDLAANLGYAGTSPFARTFSRWAGNAPGRWRRFHFAQPARGLAD
jgi:AraC-like DNA-binding protein